MKHTLVAVFDNQADARSAKDELLAAGFSHNDVRMSDDAGTTGTSGTTGSSASHDHSDDSGIGSSIKHFFSDLFGRDDEDDRNPRSRYEGAVSGGKCVVTLSADSLPEVERAADIVERFGPIDIDEHNDGTGQVASGAMRQGSQSGMQSYSTSAQSAGSHQQGSLSGSSQQRDTAMESGRSGSARSIPVVEEQLKVGKREVQRGGVRIYSRVVEKPVDESIELRQEHVDVQRRSVDQPISGSDDSAFKEQTIEMRETSEEAVVQKSARVVEEVTIGKQVKQREEQIHDTLRHTEVEVERLDADRDSDYRSHYQSNYASSGRSYDDYAPAYAYGSQMRGKHAGRQWDEVEGDMRTDWESRHRGDDASTWDKMKSAVRHGWDRMTGDDDTHRRTT